VRENSVYMELDIFDSSEELGKFHKQILLHFHKVIIKPMILSGFEC